MTIDDTAVLAAITAPMVATIAALAVIPTMVAVIALVVMGTATIVALGIGRTGETSGACHHGHGSEQHLERHIPSFVSAIAAREGDYAGDTASFLTFCGSTRSAILILTGACWESDGNGIVQVGGLSNVASPHRAATR